MPAERRFGSDHEHYEWSPLPGRSRLSWPGGARLAVGVMVQLTTADSEAAAGLRTASLSGGLGSRPYPNVPILAHWAYGQRVGIFRILDALDRFGVRPTIVMDALTAERNPYLVDHVLQRGAEIVASGISAVDLLTEQTPEDVERSYVDESLTRIEKATGVRPRGWFSSEYSESSRTPQILADSGVRYVCDWVNDDQPYFMSHGEPPLVAMPPSYELDDANAMLQRKVTAASYGRMLVDAFDVLYREAVTSGRLYLLHLRPWLSGQPFRIGQLEGAFAHITNRPYVWTASTGEIADAFARSGAAESAPSSATPNPPREGAMG